MGKGPIVIVRLGLSLKRFAQAKGWVAYGACGTARIGRT